MAKIIFTADTLIQILQTIFDDEDLNVVVDSNRNNWKGKTINEILNISYYAFKHRANTTNDIKEVIIAQDPDLKNISLLEVLKRSFCLVSISNIQRLFSPDIDQIAVEGTLQYWLQTEKIKLLESLIETANIMLCGIKLPIEIDGENRKAILFFDNLITTINEEDEIGESAFVTVNISLMITPNVVNYTDYKIEFAITNENNQVEYIPLSITSIAIGNSMVPKSIPFTNDTSRTNTINLSNATLFTISFDGYADNKIISLFTDSALSKAAVNVENKPDNNNLYTMRLTRLGKSYIYNLRFKDYSIITKNDTGNETHTVSFTTGAVI